MTSMSMKGFSISAMPLEGRTREGLLAPSEPTSSWPVARAVGPLHLSPLPAAGNARVAPRSQDPMVRSMLLAVASALIQQRERLDALDALVGDGDTGSTFASAAERVAGEVDELPLADRAALMRRLGELVSVSMGGSSGALISIMLTSASLALEQGSGLALARTRRRGDATLRRCGPWRSHDARCLAPRDCAVGRRAWCGCGRSCRRCGRDSRDGAGIGRPFGPRPLQSFTWRRRPGRRSGCRGVRRYRRIAPVVTSTRSPRRHKVSSPEPAPS